LDGRLRGCKLDLSSCWLPWMTTVAGYLTA
jgi:hypothetical protein